MDGNYLGSFSYKINGASFYSYYIDSDYYYNSPDRRRFYNSGSSLCVTTPTLSRCYFLVNDFVNKNIKLTFVAKDSYGNLSSV